MKVVDLTEITERKKEKHIQHIREFDDYYEYCFIDDYEVKYQDFEVNSIQMEKTHVVTLETNDKFLLAGILFYKKDFELDKMLGWLENYKISYIDKEKNIIKSAGEIVMGMRFKGRTIILYTKGTKQIGFNSEDFIEITQNYNFYREKVDTTRSKNIRKDAEGIVIYLNDEKLDFIPVLEFDRDNDFIISNGNILDADFIGPYKDITLGFYKKDNLQVPVAFIADTETDVNIETYEREDGVGICFVEHNYIVDPYKLIKK